MRKKLSVLLLAVCMALLLSACSGRELLDGVSATAETLMDAYREGQQEEPYSDILEDLQDMLGGDGVIYLPPSGGIELPEIG